MLLFVIEAGMYIWKSWRDEGSHGKSQPYSGFREPVDWYKINFS